MGKARSHGGSAPFSCWREAQKNFFRVFALDSGVICAILCLLQVCNDVAGFFGGSWLPLPTLSQLAFAGQQPNDPTEDDEYR